MMANEKIIRIKTIVKDFKKTKKRSLIEATHGHQQLKDFEYLIHHIAVNDQGKEEVHHCYLYDHIANLFEQGHLIVKDNKITLNGKIIKDGTYHILVGLEPTQEVSYSDASAEKAGIRPKRLVSGMTAKQKAKEWNK